MPEVDSAAVTWLADHWIILDSIACWDQHSTAQDQDQGLRPHLLRLPALAHFWAESTQPGRNELCCTFYPSFACVFNHSLGNSEPNYGYYLWTKCSAHCILSILGFSIAGITKQSFELTFLSCLQQMESFLIEG